MEDILVMMLLSFLQGVTVTLVSNNMLLGLLSDALRNEINLTDS